MKWLLPLVPVAAALLTALPSQGRQSACPVCYDSSPTRYTTRAPDVPPPPSCVKMRRGNHLCSGTCIATTTTDSLVICCNHCFATQNPLTGQFRKGDYPAKCTIERLSDGATYDGTAVDGDADVDVSLIVVRGLLEPATPGRLEVGSRDSCEHWGISSEHARGRFTRYDDSGRYPPDQSERSTLRSIPGDSGAGIFSGGKLVAQNWGFWPGPEQGGTAVRFLLEFARNSKTLRTSYPHLRAEVVGFPDVPVVPPRIDPITPLTPVPPCVGPNCPLPSQPPVPLRRPLLPWRR